MSIRIVIVDDHRIVREGLRSLIDRQTGIEIVAEASDGRSAVRLSKELRPDVVVMDISMPDLNGIEAARHIVANCKDVKVIALSMHSDRRYIVDAFRAGASGYLVKDCCVEELVKAIHTVAVGKRYLCPDMADSVIEDYVMLVPDSEVSSLSKLTPREREVLQLLSEGKKMSEIASALGLSIKTIETYRQQIMRKLNTRSVAELTKFAIREGLTSAEG